MSRRHLRWVLLLSLPSPLLALADEPPHIWSKRFGGQGSEFCRSVAADPAGKVILGGSFTQTVNFGGGTLTCLGNEDLFLAKFSDTGAHLWSRSFGPQIGAMPFVRVAVDPYGDIFFAGDFYGPIDFGGGPLGISSARRTFLVKYDGAGNHLWSQCFGLAGSAYFRGIAVDEAGQVFLTGYFSGTVDFGGGVIACAGGRDIYLTKLDGQGNHVWSHGFGDDHWQYGLDVAVDGSGCSVLSGGMDGSVDLGGGLLTTAGGFDFFLAKFDETGSHVWSTRFGDENDQARFMIEVARRGEIAATGNLNHTVDFGGGPLTSAGSDDVFLAFFEPTGDHRWSFCTGDTLSQQGRGVAFLGSGAVVATGFFAGTVDFGGGPLTSAHPYDIFLVYLDAQGDHLCSRRYGEDGGQEAWDLAVEGPGNVLLTGFFMGSVNFGGQTLIHTSLEDVFLAKLGSGVTGFVDRPEPERVSLVAFPSPFNAAVCLEFTLTHPGPVVLQLFDTRGRKVRTLSGGELHPAGRCRFVWHGQDDHGLPVSSGTYLCRLEAEECVETRRMTLLK